MLMRRAARVDSTQAEIVQALRDGGAYVWVIGLPVDLLVGYANRTALVECKRLTGKKRPRATPYTALQRDFMGQWLGGPLATLTDAAGARNLLKTLDSAEDTIGA